MNIKTLVRAVTAAVAVPAIVACGGGGGDPAPGIGGSPTASKGLSQGPITGFGSVFVNGVEIEIPSGTRIEVEGESKTERDLRIGMVVKIEWEKDASGRAAAKSIKYADDVQGPVRDINPVAGTFTVLKQSVIVDRLTKFELDDSSTPITSLNALKNGDIVEVSGLRDASGAIRATRIEVKTGTSASSEFELKGIVSNFNDATKTFTIGTITVSYVTANQVPGGTWGNTSCAEVKGSMPGDTLVAARIKLDDSCSLGGSISADSEVEVEGFVTGLAGSDFKVNGQAVRVTSATRYKHGSQANLMENTRVEAEGFISNGVLIAKKVSFKLGSDDNRSGSGDDSSSPYKEIKGRVSGVPSNGTVTITNSAGQPIIIIVNSTTILEDGIKLDLSNLLSGQGLEVYYREQDGERIAIRIHREDSV